MVVVGSSVAALRRALAGREGWVLEQAVEAAGTPGNVGAVPLLLPLVEGLGEPGAWIERDPCGVATVVALGRIGDGGRCRGWWGVLRVVGAAFSRYEGGRAEALEALWQALEQISAPVERVDRVLAVEIAGAVERVGLWTEYGYSPSDVLVATEPGFAISCLVKEVDLSAGEPVWIEGEGQAFLLPLEHVDLAPLERCPRLQTLILSHNCLSAVDLSPLKRCTRLRVLDLSANALRDVDLDPLQYCEALEVVGLEGNPELCDVDVSALFRCRRLRELRHGSSELHAKASLKGVEPPSALRDPLDSIVWNG
jgi:hypothetical protein